MSIYRRRKHDIPELNTASLPDLIFTILFFFMLVTHMRKTTVKVKYQVPQGTELTKLVKKSAISYIYIGTPTDATGEALGDSMCVQLNDKIVDLKDIKGYLAKERQTMSAVDRKQMSASVRADKNTPMGMINNIKQSLRESNVLKVNFAATFKKHNTTTSYQCKLHESHTLVYRAFATFGHDKSAPTVDARGQISYVRGINIGCT